MYSYILIINISILRNIIYFIIYFNILYFCITLITFYDYLIFFLISAIADLGSISKNKIH